MKPCPSCNHPILDNASYCSCGWREFRDIEAIEREMYGHGDNPIVAKMRARLRAVPLGKIGKLLQREPGDDEEEAA